jgi:AraC-like DNA-binding protein
LRKITYQGKTLTISEWARKLGIPSPRINQRINKLGWNPTDTLTLPFGKAALVTINGETNTIKYFAEKYGFNRNSAYNRAKRKKCSLQRAVAHYAKQ